ncbi:MAG: hypothetical protein R3B95_20385 [Nitrospirales bacterium]|nr:hypothetical protein [Nitrospirales bacterium]
MLQHLGATELAKALGVSRQSVYRAEKYGRIKRESSGLFDLEKVRRDWSNNTNPKINGASWYLSEGQGKPESEHPALSYLQAVWAHSLNGMAQVLRDVGGLSPKTAYQCVAIMFLIQWEVLAEANNIPESQRSIQFTGAMKDLINLKCRKGLEKWLDAQPAINWEGKPKERIVKGGSSHAKR